MKVLVAPAHVLLSSKTGSEPTWAYNVASRLAKNFNIRIEAVCGRFENTTLPLNARVYEVGFSGGDMIKNFLFHRGCYNVAEMLYKNVDLVHHMFPFGFRRGFNLLAVLGHLKDKPFIIGPIQYPQEYTDITDYMWVSGRQKMTGTKLMFALENSLFRLISKPVNLLHETTLREAEALVFDSKKTIRLYEELYPDILKGKILEVIPPGVETEMFKYVSPMKKDYFEILTAGYLLKRKGIQYLIEAMPLILKEFKNTRLRIVGGGPYKGELIRLVKSLSLNGATSFEGKVPRDKMINYYVACDIYVQPSLSETFPSTVREAMAVGRPIMATNVGFISEHIVDGVTGFIIPKANTKDMAERILALLSNDEQRFKMGIESHNYTEHVFNWKTIVAKWHRVYCRAIKQ